MKSSAFCVALDDVCVLQIPDISGSDKRQIAHLAGKKEYSRSCQRVLWIASTDLMENDAFISIPSALLSFIVS